MNENLMIREFSGDVYKDANHITNAVTKNIGQAWEPLRISVSIWEDKNLCTEFLSEYGDKRTSLDLDYHIVNCCDEGITTIILNNVHHYLLHTGVRIDVLHKTKTSILIKVNPISFILQTSLLLDSLKAFLKNPDKVKLNWFATIDEVIDYIIHSTYINISNNIYEFDIILGNNKRMQTSSSNDIIISFDKSITPDIFKFCEILCDKLNFEFEGNIEYSHVSNDKTFSTDTIHVKVLKECEKIKEREV